MAGDGPVNLFTHPPTPQLDRHVAVLVLPLPRTKALTVALLTQHTDETVVVTIDVAWQEVGFVVALRVRVKLGG